MIIITCPDYLSRTSRHAVLANKMHTVYVDANVFQISVTHRPSDVARHVLWGGRLHKWLTRVMTAWHPRQAWLREQAAALPYVGEQARRGQLRLLTGPEVRCETFFLKHGQLAWTGASTFAGAAVEVVDPPFYLDRVFIAHSDQRGDAAARRDFALSRTDDARFNELKRAAGGNKDADAYHIRCAEHAQADVFLTTDKRLKNSLVNQKLVSLRTTLLYPTELVALLAA